MNHASHWGLRGCSSPLGGGGDLGPQQVDERLFGFGEFGREDAVQRASAWTTMNRMPAASWLSPSSLSNGAVM